MSAQQQLQIGRHLKLMVTVVCFILANGTAVLGRQKYSSQRRILRPVEPQASATKDDTRKLAMKSEAEGETLRAEWKEQSLREAINKYTVAYLYWQSIGSQRDAAEALETLGELHFALSEYRPALTAYNEALGIRRTSNDLLGTIGVLDRIGYTYIYLGQNQKALTSLQQGMSALSKLPLASDDNERKRKEAQLLNSLGEVYYSLSDVKKALDSFNRSLALWTTLGDRKGQALAHLNIGYLYSNFGDLKGANQEYDYSLSLSLTIGHKRGEALALTAMGGVHSFLGEQQAALELHNQALGIFRFIGDQEGEAATLNGIGTAYEGLNKPQEALDNYERAMLLYQTIGNLDYEALGKFYVGAIHKKLGAIDRAREYYHQSLWLLRKVGDQRLETYVLRDLAATYNAAGQTAKALDQYQRVLRLYGKFADKRGQANTLNSIADIYATAGRTREALDLYKRALTLIQAAQDRNSEIATLYQLARAEREAGDTGQALARLKKSIDLIEGLRINAGRPDLRASYFASIHKHYELCVDLLMEMDKHHPGEGFASMAFFTSERSRARSLLEMLAEARVDLRGGADPALIEQSDSVERKLDAKAQYQMRLLSATPNKSDVEEVEKEIRTLTVAYDEIQAQIRKQSSAYEVLTQPVLLHLEEIQAELRASNTLLLEYALGDQRSYLWAITSDSFSSYELPARSTLETNAAEVYELLTARQPVKGETQAHYEERVAIADKQYWTKALVLSQMLLKPVANHLGTKRLIVVAEGALQYLPFEALPIESVNPSYSSSGAISNSSAADHETFVRHHEILYLQSASMLAALRRAKGSSESLHKGIVVLADPVFTRDDPRVHLNAGRQVNENTPETTELRRSVRDFGASDGQLALARLPSTLREAELIVRAAPTGSTNVITGFQANKTAALNSNINRYKIVHFATHGIINSEHPELSGVVLSLVDQNGDTQSGFLRLSDVYKLKLDSDLIVLSACRSALGKQISGEGFVGLTRGFMSGGARNVVASLWKVDDEATAELMNHFYRGMLKEGLPPAAALRKAKQELQATPQWSHPYYWAAFVIQGEYGERIRIDSTSTSKTPIIAAILAALALSGLYAGRRMRIRLAAR